MGSEEIVIGLVDPRVRPVVASGASLLQRLIDAKMVQRPVLQGLDARLASGRGTEAGQQIDTVVVSADVLAEEQLALPGAGSKRQGRSLAVDAVDAGLVEELLLVEAVLGGQGLLEPKLVVLLEKVLGGLWVVDVLQKRAVLQQERSDQVLDEDVEFQKDVDEVAVEHGPNRNDLHDDIANDEKHGHDQALAIAVGIFCCICVLRSARPLLPKSKLKHHLHERLGVPKAGDGAQEPAHGPDDDRVVQLAEPLLVLLLAGHARELALEVQDPAREQARDEEVNRRQEVDQVDHAHDVQDVQDREAALDREQDERDQDDVALARVSEEDARQ